MIGGIAVWMAVGWRPVLPSATRPAVVSSNNTLATDILDDMQEGVLLLDAADRVEHANPALRQMLLLRPDTRGRPLGEIVHLETLHALFGRARRLATAISEEIDVTGLETRRLLVRVAPTHHAKGALLAVFVDVTSLRRLESLRRDFVANVSHELRTPVAAIRAAAETLLAGALDDALVARGFSEIIERQARRLERLLEDLLDLARIESGEIALGLEPVELGELTDSVLVLHHEQAQSKRIELGSQLSSSLVIRANRRGLEQVLGNLIDNAIKYCPEGARVAIAAGMAGNDVRIEVLDNGPGIASVHLPRLFERFYRVDIGRSRDLGGTGLGLAIVKHLVEAMGGSVSVDSAVGRGTAFYITLPRA